MLGRPKHSPFLQVLTTFASFVNPLTAQPRPFCVWNWISKCVENKTVRVEKERGKNFFSSHPQQVKDFSWPQITQIQCIQTCSRKSRYWLINAIGVFVPFKSRSRFGKSLWTTQFHPLGSGGRLFSVPLTLTGKREMKSGRFRFVLLLWAVPSLPSALSLAAPWFRRFHPAFVCL